MNVKELRAMRAKAWEEAKAFLDSHRNESGLLSDEDTKAYEEMEKRITRLESYREIKAKKEEVKKDEKSIQEKMEELEIENELNDLKKAKGIA